MSTHDPPRGLPASLVAGPEPHRWELPLPSQGSNRGGKRMPPITHHRLLVGPGEAVLEQVEAWVCAGAVAEDRAWL